VRKPNWKSRYASNLEEAIELCADHAADKLRRPAKVMADLMGVELKTYYRWLAETSMPLNRLRQFEAFSGASFISDYLCLAHGDKVVIRIASGKKADHTDLADIHASFADAMSLLVRFYQHGESLDETVAALTCTLSKLAYQRENISKSGVPELALFGGDA